MPPINYGHHRMFSGGELSYKIPKTSSRKHSPNSYKKAPNITAVQNREKDLTYSPKCYSLEITKARNINKTPNIIHGIETQIGNKITKKEITEKAQQIEISPLRQQLIRAVSTFSRQLADSKKEEFNTVTEALDQFKKKHLRLYIYIYIYKYII